MRISDWSSDVCSSDLGLRNPTALAIQPGSGQLWAVVNERDELGPNLVPDYLTSVREGGFYGWPYSYCGQNVDPRVRPQNSQKVASAIRPDYSLVSHRSEEHTSELQSLMRISYAVFCLKKKKYT